MGNYILGSHNSMTYLEPKEWWMKIVGFTARCQKKTLVEQWNAGVRYFDLRVAFSLERKEVKGLMTLGKIANECAYFCHGLIDYKSERVDAVVAYLNEMATQTGEKVYVRVILEKENDHQCVVDDDKALFQAMCQNWKRKFKALTFVAGRRKDTWEQLYDFKTKEPSLDDKYSSMTWEVLDDWCPAIYATLMNKRNLKEGTDKEVLLLDFV